jgi:YD repeat-containing protein
MRPILAIAIVLALAAQAQGEQIKFYAPDGRSTGTAVQISPNSTRYFDERGRTIGTSTTTSGTTIYYDARGRLTGRSTAPMEKR